MMHTLSLACRRLGSWLGTKRAAQAVLGLFLLEAIWLVCSAQYPMAFDENYHYGLIQLHAQQWLPFFTVQPHNAAVFGAVVRDPSYLYHWLMSFPYRLITLFTHNQTASIIGLRLINVAMFAYGIALYRRIIRGIGVSPALANSLLAVFVLVPVVPFLAAHINYDNMFFVAVAVTILLGMRIVEHIRRGVLQAVDVLLLVAVLCLSSLIKYPFLPVAVASVAFLVWYAWRQGLLGRAGLRTFTRSFRAIARWRQIVLVVLLLASFGLFAERYGANLVTYHDPVPSCDAVISQDECEQYGPYGRDHLYAQEKPADFHANIFGYLWQWLYGMWYRLFFAINYDYATQPPLLVISCLAVLLAVFSAVGILLRLRWLFAAQPLRQLILWITVGYVVVLFADGFSSYKRTGQPVAINGRYLIAFLPLIGAFGGLAWAQLLRRRAMLKAALAGLVLAVFLLQGGGTMTFVIRSADTWMWPNGAVRATNRVVRSIAWPFTIGKGTY